MLTIKQIDAAKPKQKPYRLTDTGGLGLYISVAGSKVWRLRYEVQGKEKLLTLGKYPLLSLAAARQLREEAKALLSSGIDPSLHKRAQLAETKSACASTFKALALEWYAVRSNRWSKKYSEEIISMFNKDIFPMIGDIPIRDIKPRMLLEVLRVFERRGAIERAKKARRRCGEVFRFAMATGLVEYNPAPDLTIAMATATPKHYPFLTVEQLPDFNRALAGYTGSIIVKIATQLLQLTGLRTIELRLSKWSWINLDLGTWDIPKEVMKGRRPHVVPLSHQAIKLLEQLRPMTSHYEYLFPGRNDQNKPISENTILGLIRRIGYDGIASGHGFRHQMSTILNENRFDPDLIERQLAHVDKNKIRGIYNHAQYLPERRKMLQWYANYIDSL
ncbi:integrase [Sodalis sp. TME1]|nr:integrase [Sodalis sp. TME1]